MSKHWLPSQDVFSLCCLSCFPVAGCLVYTEKTHFLSPTPFQIRCSLKEKYFFLVQFPLNNNKEKYRKISRCFLLNYFKAVLKLIYLTLIGCRQELDDVCILKFLCSKTNSLPDKEAWHLEGCTVWQTRLIMNEPILYNQKGEECYKLGISMLFIMDGSGTLLRLSLMLRLAVGHRDLMLLSLLLASSWESPSQGICRMRNANLGDMVCSSWDWWLLIIRLGGG